MPTSLAEQLWEFSRQEGGTLFMTLIAALNVLLRRYTGEDDILVGTPIAGRNRTELEDMIGYFTNTLVFRTDLSRDPTFRELFGRVRETALGAFANQDAPFEVLVQQLQPQRSLSHTPLFQVLFVHQNAVPDSLLEFAGTTSTTLRMQPETAKFDLIVGMGEHPEGLHASFEYCTDLFAEQTITRMQAHFHRLLEGIAEDPDRHLSELPLLAEGEWRQILVDWNSTSAEWPSERRIHELVEQQAARTPEAVAVSAAGNSLTYGELDARANRLGRYLQELGIGRDTPVGLCAERSPELLVGLLGILKAGGACVPLDPAYPEARLEFMLRDSGAHVLLTHERLAGRLSETGAREVVLDADWSVIEEQSAATLPSGGGPDDLAYVIYTSGSTGEPRGVMLTHRGLVNHALAVAALYGVRPDDRVLQFSSISFDISIEEIFATWLSGATLVLRSELVPMLGPEWLDWLRRERVTILDLPTAYWHAWVNDLWSARANLPECVRVVIVGGEKAHAQSYITWLGSGGDRVRWFNTYGPTEASVVATYYEGPSAAEAVPADLPIGRPIANVEVYVLDRERQPVPVGVPGELYIGGVGIARGYLNRPELTVDRFIHDAFAGNPEARLYQTGDLVRYNSDGDLAFVGRSDHQLKIRGYRVEPGEVETVLRQHPSVGEALVLGDDVGGDARLAAYVVPKLGSDAPAADELQRFLGDQLPDFMVPTAFALLETFPLTPNGKVDRDALPVPEFGRAEARELVLPHTATEEALASIWRDVLSVDPIGVHDNFFSLGGHSLLATQVVSRARQAFGLDLTLRSIFDAPTIEELAGAIDASVHDRRVSSEPQLRPLAREGRRITLTLEPIGPSRPEE